MANFNAVNNDGTDVDMTLISGCGCKSLNDCEKCPRYYSCDTVAYANDLLVEYEEGM